MPQKAGEPPDPEKAAKLEARRKAYALKVWKADPKTQAQQQELDAARAQLQRLQDGTFCRQFQEMLAWCKRVEGEREGLERRAMQAEGERSKEHITAAVNESFAKAEIKGLKEKLKEAEGRAEKEWDARTDLELEVQDLKKEVARLEARRGAPQEPEEEEEVSPHVLVCQQHAEDRCEITARLGKMDKTLQGVVAALGFVANANERAAKSKSSGAASSCGQKRKRDGRGGDRKSGLYLLQCRMGQIPLAEACKK